MDTKQFIDDLISKKEDITDIDFNKLSSILWVSQSWRINGVIYYVWPIEEDKLQLMKDNIKWSAELIEITKEEFNNKFKSIEIPNI